MSKLWCKLWNFVLNTFTSVVEGVGILLETIGTVLVDVLSGVASAVGDALGLDGSTVLFIGLGVLAYLLLGRDKSKDKGLDQNVMGVSSNGVISV